ncbi:MAG: arginine N-succinyltransferase [Actinomycetota bacterium]|nr:arginine N-succinyltransferase [Actinomycetota bacterium]
MLVDLAAGRMQTQRGVSRSLFFVLAEADGRLIGVSGVVFKDRVLNLAVHIRTSEDGNGLVARSSSTPWTRTELNSTFLAPAGRGAGHGTLLSRRRLLFLLIVGSQVPPLLVSHLRGVFDSDGTAPFWRSFGARFLPEWPTSPDAERALQTDPARIALLSRRVITLTPELLGSLGPVNAASQPAFCLLRAEDLRPNGMYDPVDGGPTIMRSLSQTTSARRRIVASAVIDDAAGPTDALVSTVSVSDFAATRGQVDLRADGSIAISSSTARRLSIATGALISVVPLESVESPR